MTTDLAVRAFIAGFGLGLVVAGGCFVAYLTWGPALRESRAERQLKEMREGAYREALRALEQSEANLQEVQDQEQERKQQREELQQGLEEFDKRLNEVRDPEGGRSRERSPMERTHRLLLTVFAAGFCLGLLVASGCFGTYLVLGSKPRAVPTAPFPMGTRAIR